MTRASLAGAALALACLCGCSWGQGAGTGTGTRMLSAETGIGFEHQTSPLVRVSPQGTLVYLPGLQRLSGTFLHLHADGFVDTPLGPGRTVSLAGSATLKRAPSSRDLDFLSAAAQPAVHWSLPGVTLGAGLSLQRMDVAGRPFRQVRGGQLELTLPQPDGHTAVILDASRWRHPADLSDLDTQAGTLLVTRHTAQPAPGIEALEASVYLTRERNLAGFSELSSRGAVLQAGVQWKAWGLAWRAGAAVQAIRFDASAFAAEPPRRDRALSADLSVRWPLGAGRSMRLEYNRARNRSTTRLFDNDFSQLACVVQFDA